MQEIFGKSALPMSPAPLSRLNSSAGLDGRDTGFDTPMYSCKVRVGAARKAPGGAIRV
jgi:hypothetical protein